jgi:hypothetical protein
MYVHNANTQTYPVPFSQSRVLIKTAARRLAGQKQQEWKQTFVQLIAKLRFETRRAQVFEKGRSAAIWYLCSA